MLPYSQVLHPAGNDINVNAEVTRLYLQNLLPEIVKVRCFDLKWFTHPSYALWLGTGWYVDQPGDDFNYGSCVMFDVLCLQHISKRIHFGKYVAESKFRASPAEYEPLIKAQDAAGLMSKLTFKDVEKKVVERVKQKAAIYGQDLSGNKPPPYLGDGGTFKVEPEKVAQLYADWIMPLTKEVQVAYLLCRLD